MLNNYLPDNIEDRRLLKSFFYVLFLMINGVTQTDAICQAGSRFKVRISDIDILLKDLFSIEL